VAVFAATAAPLSPDAAALRRALRMPGGARRFRDIPVDWYDERATTWRPTAVASPTSPDRGVMWTDVFVPIDDGVAVAPVLVDSLRLAHGHSDAVTRFWVIRYRLRLGRLLAAGLDDLGRAVVSAALDGLAAAEAEMRDVWLTAYAHGMPPRPVHTLFRPSGVLLRAEPASAGPAATSNSMGSMLSAALDIYGAEAQRIRGALRMAGCGSREVQRHPLCAVLVRLGAAAEAELGRHRGVGHVVLDPAVWSP
jgi:hypothetical protein